MSRLCSFFLMQQSISSLSKWGSFMIISKLTRTSTSTFGYTSLNVLQRTRKHNKRMIHHYALLNSESNTLSHVECYILAYFPNDSYSIRNFLFQICEAFVFRNKSKGLQPAAPTMWGLEGPSPLRNNSVGAEPPQKFQLFIKLYTYIHTHIYVYI